jgi:hypothetical protein
MMLKLSFLLLLAFTDIAMSRTIGEAAHSNVIIMHVNNLVNFALM